MHFPAPYLILLAIPALASSTPVDPSADLGTNPHHPSGRLFTTFEMSRLIGYNDYGLIVSENTRPGRYGEVIQERVEVMVMAQQTLQYFSPLDAQSLDSSIGLWEDFRDEAPDRMKMHVSTYKAAMQALTDAIREMESNTFPSDVELLTLQLLIHHILLTGAIFQVCQYQIPPSYLTGQAFDLYNALIDVLAVDVRDQMRFQWDFTREMPFLGAG